MSDHSFDKPADRMHATGGSYPERERNMAPEKIGESQLGSCSPEVFTGLSIEEELAQVRADYERKMRLLEARVSESALPVNRPGSGCSSAVNVPGLVSGSMRLHDSQPEEASSFRMSEMLARLELPRLELTPFSGNPTDYWLFIRQFEALVESRVRDPSQRLAYLLHYCQGKAKQAIMGCFVLEGSEGYSKARCTLQDRFGRPHQVAKALVEDLLAKQWKLSTPEGLTDFADKMECCEVSLKQLNHSSDLNCAATLDRVALMLPHDARKKWVDRAYDIQEEGREPTFRDMRIFIRRLSEVANSRYGYLLQTSSKPGRWDTPASHHTVRQFTGLTRSTTVSCFICNHDHPVPECYAFRRLSVSERIQQAKAGGLCFRCLTAGHVLTTCTSNLRCSVEGCGQKHHSLLHRQKASPKNKATSESALPPKSTNSTVCMTAARGWKIGLGVLPVKIQGPKGTCITNALIDNGSQSTLVTPGLAARLGLTGPPSKMDIRTVNGSNSVSCRIVSMGVESIEGGDRVQVPEALVIDGLSFGKVDRLQAKEVAQWEHLRPLSVGHYADSDIEVLIGCDVPEAHWVLEQIVGKPKQPFAVRSPLGWMVLGPTSRHDLRSTWCQYTETELDHNLRLLYEREFEDVQECKHPSADDRCAITQVETSIRLVDGHFEIGLPWRHPITANVTNCQMALRRLACLKTRFRRDSGLFEGYTAVIDRYLASGYAEPADEYPPVKRWYLPHHPVLNPKKPGKVRVVFDCAAKSAGYSLNDCLLQGPNTVADLPRVLLRFRRWPIAIVGDIEDMFLQVKVPPPDRPALSFWWWPGNDMTKRPRTFQLTVHPFGATSSPFCANFALRSSARFIPDSPEQPVKEVIDNDFYVDDCLSSVKLESEAVSIVSGLTTTLAQAGFHIKKWTSNSLMVLQSIPIENVSQTVVDLGFSKLPINKTLGLEWDAQSDGFRFSFTPMTQPETRRGVLSYVSSLYDPLGFLSPVILCAKSILQRACRAGLSWDDELPEAESKFWRKWLQLLPHISHVQIPRCLFPDPGYSLSNLELHLFSDASETGYGVVAYLAVLGGSHNGKYRLLYSKSRVTPLKAVTIPRLELNAARLAVKIAVWLNGTIIELGCPTFLWTDSTTVLYYLHNSTSRYTTFVNNRVSFIREHTQLQQWRYVKGKDNPADLVSRGLFPDDPRLTRWIDGSILESVDLHATNIPATTKALEDETTLQVHLIVNHVEPVWGEIFERYSTWDRLVRAIVWLTRFKRYFMLLHCTSRVSSIDVGPLRVVELKAATNDIIRITQRTAFPVELSTLLSDSGAGLPANSKLKRLCPTVRDRLLVVGGRLPNSNIAQSAIYPIILPSRNRVTDLIIERYHHMEGHMGTQHVLSVVRQKYWILKGVANTKRVIGACRLCRRTFGATGSQIMAPLPQCRVTSGWHPFESVGVDYFGPIKVSQKRSLVKRFGCLFTCMRSRAIHLELAYSLSTDSFLSAFIRFVGRRGIPHEIYSDNGSNFVGAEKELTQALRELNQERLHEHMGSRGIQWHFQPAECSHRGGVWERVIRTVKRVLVSVAGEQTLTDETLLTLLVDIERIVNNRPLVPNLDDPDASLPLSPNDLILLRTPTEVTTPRSFDARLFVSRWKQCQYLTGVFWNRWVREYLPTLQPRSKWLKCRPNFKVGNLVLIVTEKRPYGKWPLGKVVQIYPSSDGQVRRVDVQTEKGIVQRDVRNLRRLEGDCVLPDT